MVARRSIVYASRASAEAPMAQFSGILLSLMLLLSPQFAYACGVIAQAPRLMRASLLAEADAALTITFLGHASFLIETPGHVTAVTDYNGVNIPADPPDIATMNHAHSTHNTDHPDPRGNPGAAGAVLLASPGAAPIWLPTGEPGLDLPHSRWKKT
jgi:hypothetical protein